MTIQQHDLNVLSLLSLADQPEATMEVVRRNRMRRESTALTQRHCLPQVPHLPSVTSASPPRARTFRLARADQPKDTHRDTRIAAWTGAVVRACGPATDAIGLGIELEGDALAELQRRTNSAFVRPVFRITLCEPLLAFRFYGDLCFQVTQLYTSLATVCQVPAFGRVTRDLLGLTGRNSADHLVAMRIESGSEITVGGISNRATWADQILVESSAGLTVVADVTAAQLMR